MAGKVKKKIKVIKIDADKCNGCRACEMICSAFHSRPRYSSNNPARARIRVISDPLRDIFLPVYAGDHAPAECAGRNRYLLAGKEYDECTFCRASCSVREFFKEPDSGLPLKCDMCESDPPLPEPLCVKWCITGALTFEEREEEAQQQEPQPPEIEQGLETLVDKFGLEKVAETLARLSRRQEPR